MKYLDKILIKNITSETELEELKSIIYGFNSDSRILDLQYPQPDIVGSYYFFINLSKIISYYLGPTLGGGILTYSSYINIYETPSEFKKSIRSCEVILKKQNSPDILYYLIDLGYIDSQNDVFTFPEDGKNYNIFVSVYSKTYRITTQDKDDSDPFVFITHNPKNFKIYLMRISEALDCGRDD